MCNLLLNSGKKLHTFISFLIHFYDNYGLCRKRGEKGETLARAKEYKEKSELKKAVIEHRNVVQLDHEDDNAYYESVTAASS